jgi:hypothetical protein
MRRIHTFNSKEIIILTIHIQTRTVPSTPPDINLPLQTDNDHTPASVVSNQRCNDHSINSQLRPARHTDMILPAPADTISPV